jgi:hypothetical protein
MQKLPESSIKNTFSRQKCMKIIIEAEGGGKMIEISF